MIQFAWRGWILAMLLGVLAFFRWNSHAPLWYPGILLVLLGAGYRLYAGQFIPDHSNFLRMSGEKLTMGGPYLFSRHPLYLSNLATIAGLILFANCTPIWGSTVLLCVAFVHHEVLARSEERYLATAWGEAYQSYMRVTPRWIGFPRKALVTRPELSGASLGQAWARQGGNLGKTFTCLFLIWLIAMIAQ